MFESARLKLTLWYVLTIMLISIAFSVVIFTLLSREVERFAALQRLRLEKRIQDVIILQPGTPFPDPSVIDSSEAELIQELKERLILILGLVNGAIFIASSGFAYILAGKTLKPIQEMVNEQHRFISDASHELRTPLTSLRSAFEVYLRGKQNLIEAKVVISEGLEDVKKLQQLSDSLLQLAHYQQPIDKVSFKKFALDSSIDAALRRVKPIAKQKNITLQFEKENASVYGSEENLTDLWVIFLDNAIKYSPEKSIITVSCLRKDGYAFISIQDHGMGIEEKSVKHIFDRFYRANSARSKNESGGYGLGLSIAKKIIDLHKGTVIVKSKPNEGTAFIIKLPVKN